MSVTTMWSDHKDYLNAHIIDPAMRDCLRDLSQCFTEGAINAAMYRVATQLHPAFCKMFNCRNKTLAELYTDFHRSQAIAYYTLCYEFAHFDHIAKISNNIPEDMYGKSPLLDQVVAWHMHHNAVLATGSVAITGGNPMLFRGATELPLTIVK